jgi:hypothetical protein
MKTSSTEIIATEQELDLLSKRDLILIKTTIVIFTVVLNICFFHLFFS